ncbi:TM1802 family CRISPR-associated protein [Desulfofundulus salinus]|uniref:Type I-B CRISPR-associated protein Cas8b/Csh1 n=1 Tax=Desulfofundulus salinus TaxID=2419843 RepID=A0A494X1B3_9FIRM|nr:TM1802 family CRISPR-associated protein [Desulfofundulus salinum]RKO66710.1 hypothetical protein D7024_06975 [Desulfofundulus salinum]
MFIEKLVAQGRPFLAYGMSPAETLRQISDVKEQGRFLENVIVIEAEGEEKFKTDALPLQTWGRYDEQGGTRRKKKIIFQAEVDRGLGTPFVIVSGGNKRAPQGRYGVPVYPVFPSHIPLLAASEKEALSFWQGRLKRTLSLPRVFSQDEEMRLAGLLKRAAADVAKKMEESQSQGHALVVLVSPQPEGPYRYADKMPVKGDRDYTLVGESVLNPGKYIVAHLPTVARYFWASKMEEGAEKGKRERCSLCGREGEAVSAYSKAWPLLAPTWHPPISEELKKGKNIDLAAAIGALCRECYSSLIVGAGVFDELSTRLPLSLTRELFVPVASAGGREVARRSKSQPPGIWGCALVVSLFAEQGEEQGEFFTDALKTLRLKQIRPDRQDRLITAITGFEAVLPDEFNSDQYRLTLIYYSGNPAQGDVHLRAVIEDVLPSTVSRLLDYMPQVAEEAVHVRRRLVGERNEEQRDGRYDSLFYLLTRAYGGCYLWHALRSVLHRRPIAWDAFTAGAAARMNGWARLGDEKLSYWNLRYEVIFYLAFRRFYNLYNSLLPGGGRKVGDWREMLNKVSSVSPAELSFDNVEELGFAAGYLVRLFDRWYWTKTGGDRGGKNFVKHRIMAFGSSLTPEMIWKKGLSRFQEYALKLDMGLPDDFRRRAGVVESEYRRLKEQVMAHKDDFIGAFWSGYALAFPAKQSD